MPPPAGVALLGEWEAPFDHPVQFCVNATMPRFNPVHACLIPLDPANPSPNNWGGKVLVWDKSESPTACASTNGDYGQRWAIVDPETAQIVSWGTFNIPFGEAPPAAGPADPVNHPDGFQGLFCSSHCWLRDGRLFVAGGDDWSQENAPTTGTNPNPAVKYGGSALICIFDPFVPVNANPWSVLRDSTPLQDLIHLRDRRWYPTVIRLADLNDTVIVAGGVETFDLDTAQLRPIELAHETYEAFQTYFPNQPGVITRDTSAGITVGAGRTLGTGFIAGLFAGPQIQATPQSSTNHSFYYFPRLHLASRDTLGGANGAIGLDGRLWMAGMPAESFWMDHINANMAYSLPGPAMSIVSSGVDLLIEEPATVLLPNYPAAFKDILVVMGGGQNSSHGAGGDNCFWPEVFLNGTWQYCAKEVSFNPPLDEGSPRTYHSSALLLPSGKVLSCGGDTRIHDYQVFRPHYYTSNPANRPQFSGVLPAPTLIHYGVPFNFSFTVPPMQTLEKVVLTTPGSWTHAQDPAQRCVVLEFATEPGGLGNAVGPPSRSEAPPGLYMLWLVSTTGVPSVATWVRLD